MLLKDLIGKEILDIHVKVEYESYGLDKADSFITLSNNVTIGIPWSIDNGDEVWIRDIDKEAKSVFADKKNKKLTSLKGKKIIDLLAYNNNEGAMEAEKAFIEVEDGKLITEITIAPNGTGLVGLWIFDSIQELEKRYGTDCKRLSDRIAIRDIDPSK